MISSGNCQLGGNRPDKVIKLGELRKKMLDRVVIWAGTNCVVKLAYLSTQRKTASSGAVQGVGPWNG